MVLKRRPFRVAFFVAKEFVNNMPGCTPIWEGVPPRPRDFGGVGYPYHHHHGFGSGAGVRGSPLPTTADFIEFYRILSDVTAM